MSRTIARTEAVIVFLILTLIAAIGGAKLCDCSSALAVFIGFIYSQLSFDIAEKSNPLANAPRSLKQLYLLKELAWLITFILLKNWPLLIGATIFICYPYLRSWARTRWITTP